MADRREPAVSAYVHGVLAKLTAAAAASSSSSSSSKSLVRRLCCMSSPQMNTDDSMSREVIKPIREKMDRLAGLPPCRGEIKEKIIEQLLSEDDDGDEGPSVVSIVGRSGVGKSALARLVFDDERVAERFGTRRWVCASEAGDAEKLCRLIYPPSAEHPAAREDYSRDDFRSDRMMSTRFLLVLDDVGDGVADWTALQKRWDWAEEGSKVILTTRSEKTAAMLGTAPPLLLGCLSMEDSSLLFNECAFAGDGDDSSLHRELEAIGGEIVEKLEGLPLAIRMVGCLLSCHREQDYWKSILESLTDDDYDVVLAAVELCYLNLPLELRRCLAYLSVLPRGRELEKDELIQMWTAEGLLPTEDAGSGCFERLLATSFLQIFSGKYIVHSPVHDFLLRRISVDDTLRLTKPGGGDVATVETCHLLLQDDESESADFMDSGSARRLHTFIFSRTGYRSFDYDALFRKMELLRVLQLSAPCIRRLPESISGLTHLRYLDLSPTRVYELPESLCSLYRLETLRLNRKQPRCLPYGMSKLARLRHLRASKEAVSEIAGIGSLTALLDLERFNVKRRRCHTVAELKGLRELRGSLHIANLGRVSSGAEATEAKLNEKEHIRSLKLDWDLIDNMLPKYMPTKLREEKLWEGRTRELDDDVLESLQPHHNLKELTISYHCGRRLPSWLKSECLAGLDTVRLHYCLSWRFLPLGRLRSLRTLEIVHHSAEDAGVPQCFGVQGWEDLEEAGDDVHLFPSLRVLRIENCLKLHALPLLPPSLEELHIDNVPKLSSLPGLWGCDDGLGSSSSSSSSSLASLHISGCSRLRSLREGLFQHRLGNLRSLTIRNCRALASLPKDGLRSLVSLESLDIVGCPKLTFSSDSDGLPPSLVNIRIHSSCGVTNDSLISGLEGLASLTSLRIGATEDAQVTSLPGGLLQHLAELRNLDISYCRRLEVLDFEALASLRNLEIVNCPMLAPPSSSDCQRGEEGASRLARLSVRESSLRFLTGERLKRLSGLRDLVVERCWQVSALCRGIDEASSGLGSLRTTCIRDCPGLRRLPAGLGSLTCLEELMITNCVRLHSLPVKGLPASLSLLVINNSRLPLEEFGAGGAHWPKVAHILVVRMYNDGDFHLFDHAAGSYDEDHGS